MKPLGFGSHSPFSPHVVIISSPERHKRVMLSPVMGGFLLSVLLIIITDIESDIPSDSLVRNSHVAIYTYTKTNN